MGLIKKTLVSLQKHGIRETLERINKRVGVVRAHGTATGHICLRPFYYATINTDGAVYCCCSNWVKFWLGNVRHRPFADIWNGRVARAFRDAMLTTELDRVCKCTECPYLVSRQLPEFRSGRAQSTAQTRALFTPEIEEDPDVRAALARGDRRLAYLPKQLEIAADSRCNLYCRSCRQERITKLTPTEAQVLEVCRRIVRETGAGLKVLSLLSSGEVFFSRFCLDLLAGLDRRAYPRLKVDVLTNGQLLNERLWARLGPGADFIRSVGVSIDAATRETYEELRCGGKWERLLRNLDFVRQLRAAGRLDHFSVNFVVSARNFREMKNFVRLGESLGADAVLFTGLLHWYTMDPAYASTAIQRPDHALHRELVQVLQDPVFKSEKVIMGL